jgi:hypothetical protein
MHSLLTHKASEIKPQTRAVLEGKLGRRLEDDEEVSFIALLPHEAPVGEAHQNACRRLNASLERIEEKVKDIPVEEFEEILLEAMRSERPGYQECREGSPR